MRKKHELGIRRKRISSKKEEREPHRFSGRVGISSNEEYYETSKNNSLSRNMNIRPYQSDNKIL